MTDDREPDSVPLSDPERAVLKTAFVAFGYGGDVADLVRALSPQDLSRLARACALIRGAALRERAARAQAVGAPETVLRAMRGGLT